MTELSVGRVSLLMNIETLNIKIRKQIPESTWLAHQAERSDNAVCEWYSTRDAEQWAALEIMSWDSETIRWTMTVNGKYKDGKISLADSLPQEFVDHVVRMIKGMVG